MLLLFVGMLPRAPHTLALTFSAALIALPPATTVSVGPDTRLLVIAPHPDDEVLAAGGLLQHLRAANGALRVVYLTSGEAYREGVQREDRVASPTASNYRAYGKRREQEAYAALRALGFGAESLSFLGFPNAGLTRLMTTYWSERRAAFRSPYTRRDRPNAPDIVVADSEFRGEDLTQELVEIMSDFRPTMILVPRREDQHADHCAAWFFVADALADLTRVHPDRDVDLVTYIVHYYSWLFEDDASWTPPPPDLSGGESGWLNVPLSLGELQTKRRALGLYKSQMDIMAWFLNGFARRNEWFSRQPRSNVTLPVRRNPCVSS